MTLKTILLTSASIVLLCYACREEIPTPEPEPDTSFEKRWGGALNDQAKDFLIKDNALFIVGSSQSMDDPNGDHYLAKLDLAGNLLFEKSYGGDKAEEGRTILATQDGNFLLLGITESYGNGEKDIHLIKVDQQGNELWQKTFGGLANDTPAKIIETSQGEFCLAATTESFGAGARDIYLLWLDQAGQLLREKTFGGPDIDGSTALLELNSQELLLYGYTKNFGATSRDLYLLRLSPEGDSLWSQRYGGDDYEESQAFRPTADGGFLLCGHSASTSPEHNMIGIRLDAAGQEVWSNNYGGNAHDGGEALLINAAGEYVFVGRSKSYGNGERDIFMVRTSPQGEVLSEAVLGGEENDWAEAILAHGDYYYLVGHTETADLGAELYLIKYKK